MKLHFRKEKDIFPNCYFISCYNFIEFTVAEQLIVISTVCNVYSSFA